MTQDEEWQLKFREWIILPSVLREKNEGTSANYERVGQEEIEILKSAQYIGILVAAWLADFLFRETWIYF